MWIGSQPFVLLFYAGEREPGDDKIIISTVSVAVTVILCIILIPIVVLVIWWCYKKETSGTYRVEEKERANRFKETAFNSRESEEKRVGSNKEGKPESLMANEVAKDK